MEAKPEITDRKAGDAITVALKPRARRINDACSILQISRSHIYALAAKSEIKLVRIGNRTLVPESEIDRLLGEVA